LAQELNLLGSHKASKNSISDSEGPPRLGRTTCRRELFFSADETHWLALDKEICCDHEQRFTTEGAKGTMRPRSHSRDTKVTLIQEHLRLWSPAQAKVDENGKKIHF
jgi:hypothetical protein